MSTDTSPNSRLIGFLYLGITATGWAMNWPIIKILLRDWPRCLRAALPASWC
jgi:hypothetical protein